MTMRLHAQDNIELLRAEGYTDGEKIAAAIFSLASTLNYVFSAGASESAQPLEAIAIELRDGLDKMAGAISNCAASIEGARGEE